MNAIRFLRSGLFAFAILLSLLPMSRPAIAGLLDQIPSNDQPSNPIVYTGYLRHDRLNKKQMIRFQFIPFHKVGIAVTQYNVIVNLYLGDETSREYMAMYYDQIQVFPERKNMLLMKDDDGRSRRLPLIKLTWNENLSELNGSLIDEMEGAVGNFSASNSWTAKPLAADLPVIEPVSGIYDADCLSTDSSGAFSLKSVEIIPSRIFVDRTTPESTLGETNYIGNGLCQYGSYVNCANFSAGSLNIFRDNLLLLQSNASWSWNCHHISRTDLQCSSPRYNQCVLHRRATTESQLHLAKYAFEPRPSVSPLSFAPATTPPAPNTCDRWSGTFQGIASHFLGARQQPITLNLVAIESGGTTDADRKCTIQGSVQLWFQDGNQAKERLTYPIPTTEFAAKDEELTLLSDSSTDLAITFRPIDGNRIIGRWYSRLIGLVGDVLTTAQSNIVIAPIAQAVPSVGGRFVFNAPNGEVRWWDLLTYEAGLDKTSYDPFAQIRTTGTLTQMTPIGPTNTELYLDSINFASYDFFTNTLIMRGGGTYLGSVTQDKISLHGVVNRYLLNAHDHAVVTDFTRQVTP